MIPRFAALLVLLFVSMSSGGRTNRMQNVCSMKCDETLKSLFKAGQVYTYEYQGESEIKTSNGSYDTTGLLVKSKITLTALSNCEIKLKMEDVEVLDKTSKMENRFKITPFNEKAKETLERNEILFTHSAGEVISICMNKNEPIWAQNIKKSIIDIVANQGKDWIQYQVKNTRHGSCMVNTITNDEDLTKHVTYNVDTCSSPATQSLFKDLAEAIVFNVSKVSCKYAFQSRNDLQAVYCTEEYNTTPLRFNENSINVRITNRIEKRDSKSADMTFPKNDLVKTEIQMEDDVIEKDDEYYAATKETIKLLCDQHTSGKRSSIPRTFATLVNQLKKLTPSQVKDIYMDILKTDVCPGQIEDIRYMFYDAIGFVNTPAATSVMVDIIKNKQISDIDQAVWFTSLSFMQSTPTIEMIKDLETLLKPEETNKQMYLGISAVTHLYCKNNYESCLMDPTIRRILSFFLKDIGKDCSDSQNSDHLSKIQLSLKSLGNLKLFNEDVVEILSKCAITKSNPTAIRVSALEVMKHMDCTRDRSVAMNILQNNENDSEMRINAYLTVMGCPDINTMFKVREILAKEKVNQVGSFIWTHLTNIQESNDVLKNDVKKLLNDVELKEEFDISKLKFSRNIEKSFGAGLFGMSLDSNVIFSEKSFIPRSVSLNTTAIVLNRPTNFIEMSARIEGLDDLLFKLLGPEGYLKKQKSSTAEENLSLIKMLEEINGNLNFKLFGQQISFVELIRGSLSSIKKYNIIEELMNIGKEKSIEVKKNLILVDKVASIPTSLGFPLRFRIQGSVSINLKIKSKIDLSGLLSWPISVNIQSQFSPSVMSSFSSEITLETPFSNYGMKMNMESGTDTKFSAVISANKNEEFNIIFDTPKSKQEIISVTGKSFVVYQNKEFEQLTNTLQKYELCTQDKMKSVFGVKVCGSVEIANLETRKTALLYGPFSANVYIEKEDTQTGYVLKGLFKTTPFISANGIMYKNRFIKFQMDTPFSKHFNRKFSVEMALDFKENLIKFEVDSPWTQILMKTTFKLSEERKRVLVILQVNNKNIIKIGAEHLSSITKVMRTEKGMISFDFMNMKPSKTQWSFIGKRGEWMAKIESKGLLKDDTNLRIDVKEVKSTRQLSLFNKYKLSGSYDTYFGKGKISGAASENYYGHRWDIRLEHSPKGNTKNNFIIMYRHKTEDKSSKSLSKYFLTSTISYGESAENFVKFEIENELSERHVRASIKTNYGKSSSDESKTSEKIELQLYGGYAWKNDDRHYAEGSLSFHFPSKGLNYEGRYNSEVGKRMLKMSAMLDKDQQSKFNFKINYVQPKLYLKDTEFDVTLSLPNHNTDVKWVLKEVDVNKYQYALTGTYNKYVMKVDGTQTEISRLKHDSIIRISLPDIKNWPQTLQGELKVDLVNPTDASINGKVEIPNSKHKYSFALKMSSMPQNFLQLPLSEKPAAFSYNLEMSTIDRTIKSESILTCNPEEVQVYFNYAWNAEKNKDERVTFNFHTLHKSPNLKQIDSSARITVQYPGNSHSIGFQSAFKYTELEAQIDMTWNKNQKMSIFTTYEIDNSWTQKGLKASVTMKTPFPGLELTHLGINAIGQLRYRKVDIEFKWGGNKKILFDIAVHPKSSNDFTLTSKLVTPFKGANLIALHARHISTTNSITSEASLELGPKQRYNIKFEGVNNNEGKNRDISSTLYVESGIFYPVKISFLHKDDRVHFRSQFDVVWMKTEFINIKNEFSYTFEDGELITNGNLEFQSTIDNMKRMQAKWSIENKETTFQKYIQLLYNTKNIFENSIKGFYEKGEGIFKLEFDGSMKIFSELPYTVNNVLSYEPSTSFVNNFSLKRDTIPAYSHSITMKPTDVSIKLLILNSKFKTAEFKATYRIDGIIEYRESWMKIGELYAYKKSVKTIYIRDAEGNTNMNIESDIYSDYNPRKTIKSKSTIIFTKSSFRLKLESKSKSEVLLNTKIEIFNKPEKNSILFSIATPLKELRTLNFEYQNYLNQISQIVSIVSFNYNDILKVKSNIKIKQTQLIDIDLFFGYRDFVRYFKLKHGEQLMGYDDFLETNLFDTTILIKSSIEKRGGIAIHSSINCNFYFLKSFNVVGKFNRNFKKLDIIYKYPRINGVDEEIKLVFTKRAHVYNLDINSNALFSTSLNLNLHDYQRFNFKFQNLGIEKINIKVGYEGGLKKGKHSNEISFLFNNWNFDLTNKIENVKWSYLLLESKLKTNIESLSDYKIGLEYRKKVNDLEVDLKGHLNEMFFTARTKLMLTSDIKSEFKIKTSFPQLKEFIFEVKHKQNQALTQVIHGCTFSLKSNDKHFQLTNKVEWSESNYINVLSSIVAQTSQNEYFIKPKSVQFTHQFHKQVLRETFNLEWSDKIQFKANIVLPLKTISHSSLEVESSLPLLAKLTADFKIDLDSKEKFVKLYIKRNNIRLCNIETFMEKRNEGVLMSLKVQEKETHLIEIEYVQKNKIFEKILIITKTSLFNTNFVIDIKYDALKSEVSFTMDGFGNDKFYLTGKCSKESKFVKVMYGLKLVELSILTQPDKFILNSKLQVGYLLKCDLKIQPKEYELVLMANENILKISNILDEINVEVKVKGKIITLKLKEVSKSPYKYELSGTTNFNGWSSFKGDVYFMLNYPTVEFTSKFSKETDEVFNIMVRNQDKSFNLKYGTMANILKSGRLSVVYGKDSKKVLLALNADVSFEEDIKMNLELTKSGMKGELSSPFNWMREVTFKGELTETDKEVKGSFQMNHNMLSKPMDGDISVKIDLSSWQVNINTPMSRPFDRLSIMKKNENGNFNFEISDNDNKILKTTLDYSENSKYDMSVELNIPEKLGNVKLTLNSLINLKDVPYFVQVTSKSNLFQDITFTGSCDPMENDYKFMFSHPLRSANMVMKLSADTFSLISKYNDKTTSISLFREKKEEFKIRYILKIESNMYPKSPINVKVSCLHKINMPNELYVNLETKWNENIIFSTLINWEKKAVKGFDFKSVLTLTPYNTKYQSSLDLTNTNDEKYTLKYSKLSDSKEDTILIELVNKVEEVGISIRTPFAIITTFDFKVQMENSMEKKKQIITLNSNYFGKILMTNEYRIISGKESIVTSNLVSPLKYGNFDMEMKYKDRMVDENIDLKLKTSNNFYQMKLTWNETKNEIKINSDNDLLRKFEIRTEIESESYKMRIVYNETECTAEVKNSQTSISAVVKTNTNYVKVVSFSVDQSKNDKKGRVITITFDKDGKKMSLEFASKYSTRNLEWKNSLVPNLPNHLQGKAILTQYPFNVMLEITKDSKDLLKVIFNKNEILFRAKNEASEIKMSMTRNRFELIFLNSKVFSMIINAPSLNEMDVSVIINETQYSTTFKFVNDGEQFLVKSTAYKNEMDKLFEAYLYINKIERAFDCDLNILTKQIWKLKMSDKILNNRKISTELKVLSLTVIVDTEGINQEELMDFKIFWNIRYQEDQISFGSVFFNWKWSLPINFALNLNFPAGAYQIQVNQLDDGTYNFKLSVPFKELNIDMSFKYLYNPSTSQYKVISSFKNEIIGEYDMSWDATMTRNPEMSLKFTSNQLNFKFNYVIQKSIEGEYSIYASGKILDWDKMELLAKLEMKEKIRITIKLTSPFTLLKHLSVEKTLWIRSGFEHRFKTIMEYQGFVNVRYTGGHEISIFKRIVKFNGNMETDEIKIVSLNIEGIGKNNGIDHLFVMNFKEKRYGYRINGRFNPMFEGKTEIYTPYHNSGVLVLQGRLNPNGMKIQAGRGKEEIAAFEYSSKYDVRYMKITPPTDFGKPITMKLRQKRFRRGIREDIQANVNYGDEGLFNFNNKIDIENDKNAVIFKLSSPMLSKKSMELKLIQKYEGDNMLFNHKLKIKDSKENEYNFFGNVYHKDRNDFKYAFNLHHPYAGPAHFSFGHKYHQNTHNSHFLVKNNDQILFLHKGKLMLELKKIRGELETQFPNKNYRLVASHIGDLDNFEQELSGYYNTEPYITYKSNIIPQEKSTIDIELPILNGQKIKMTFDKKERKAGVIFKSISEEYKLDTDDKNGKFQTQMYLNNEKVIDFELGYGTQPLFMKTMFRKQYLNLETDLKESSIKLKYDTNLSTFKTATLQILKNKIMLEITRKNEVMTFNFEYHFIPYNFFLVLDTSLKQLSKASVYLTPNEMKLNFNEYFHILIYKVNEDGLELSGSTNIHSYKTFNLDAKHNKKINKMDYKISVNDFTTDFIVDYSPDNYLIAFKNNKFSPRSVEINFNKKTEKDSLVWKTTITVDQQEMMKLVAQLVDGKYALVLKTYHQTSFVTSFDQKNNELIISMTKGDDFINLVSKLQRMSSNEITTVVLDINLDSSSFYLQKISTQISYTLSKTDLFLSLSGRFNHHRFGAKLQQAQNNVLLSLYFNDNQYIARVNQPSSTKFISELITPQKTFKMEIEKMDTKYIFDIYYNKENMIKMEVKQNLDLNVFVDHSSVVWYYGQNIWNFTFYTNFNQYTLKLRKPTAIEIVLRNERKLDESRTMSIWTKYMYFGKMIEKGIGIRINVTKMSRFIEMYVENNLHMIQLTKGSNDTYDRQISAKLVNKIDKKEWQITFKRLKNERLEIHWISPEAKRGITFHQIIKDSVKTLLDVEILDTMKLELRSDTTKEKLTGSLALFGRKVARVEVNGENVKAVINEQGSELNRINLEWRKITQGTWKKDYISTRRLILKQKALNIDLDLEHQIKMETLLYSVITKSTFMVMDGTVKMITVGAVVDFSVPDTVKIEIKNPILPMKIALKRYQPTISSLRYELEAILNVNDNVNGFLEISSGQDLGITSRLYYNPKDRKEFFEVHAKYIDDRQMEVRIFSENMKKKTNYFLFLVRLLNEHNLEITYQFKIDTFKLLARKMMKVEYMISDEINNFLNENMKAINTEVVKRKLQFVSIIPDGEILNDQMKTLEFAVKAEFVAFFVELNSMFQNNEFYLMTIFETSLAGVYNSVYLVNEVYWYARRAVESIDLRIICRMVMRICRMSAQVAWRIKSMITNPIEKVFLRFVENYFPKFSINFINNVEHLINFLDRTFTIIRWKIRELRKYRKFFILEQMYKVSSGLARFLKDTFGFVKTGSLYFLSQENDIKALYDDTINILESFSNKIMQEISKILSGVDDTMYRFTGSRNCEKIRVMFSNMIKYFLSELKDERNQKWVKEMIMSSIQDSFMKVNYRIHSFTNDLIMPKYIVINRRFEETNSLDYVVSITSPLPLNDIKSIPDFTYISKKEQEIRNIIELMKRLLKERILSGHRVIELLRWFTPTLQIGSFPSLLPDFESYATILGSSVVTFDKRTLQLKSDRCKVVLAKDLQFKKWQIELEQNKNDRLYTLTVAKEKVSISIVNHKVTLNGKETDLPFNIGSTKIMAFGKVVKVKDDIIGLTITVDPTSDMFTVGISGWYHNKVRGLFGNADNEPFNDMADDNGKLLKSKEFLNVYSNGGKACGISNEIETENKEIDKCPFIRKIVCKFIYECPFSPMAACFGKVDPKRFLKMCIDNSREFETKVDAAVCNSARSYQAQCKAAGVNIPVPYPCRKCEVKDERPLMITEYRHLKIKEKVADVVFIIDEGKCLKSIASQLNRIVSKLDENLKEKGISSTRFGLVTFGGDGVNEAHSHTLNQKLFGSRTELLSSLKSLKSTNQNIKDVVGAITLAANYPFINHASKHLVLVNCDRCQESSNQFKNLIDVLNKQAIQMSMLMDYTFQVKDGESKKLIYGMDNKNIYTTLSTRGEVASNIMRPHNDYCYQLAMKRNGIVFNINFLTSKNELTQKRFIDTFTTQLTLTAKPARKLTCLCEDDGEYNCVPNDVYAIFPAKKAL